MDEIIAVLHEDWQTKLQAREMLDVWWTLRVCSTVVEFCLRTGLVVLHPVCVHVSTSSTVQKKEHTVSSVSTLRFKPSLRLARIISKINSPEGMVIHHLFFDLLAYSSHDLASLRSINFRSYESYREFFILFGYVWKCSVEQYEYTSLCSRFSASTRSIGTLEILLDPMSILRMSSDW